MAKSVYAHFLAETAQVCFPRIVFRIMLRSLTWRVSLRNLIRPGVSLRKDMKEDLSCGSSEVLALLRGKGLSLQTELGPRIILRLYYPNHTLYTFEYFLTNVIIKIIILS